MILVQHNNDGSMIFERMDDFDTPQLLIRFTKREVEDIVHAKEEGEKRLKEKQSKTQSTDHEGP